MIFCPLVFEAKAGGPARENKLPSRASPLPDVLQKESFDFPQGRPLEERLFVRPWLIKSPDIGPRPSRARRRPRCEHEIGRPCNESPVAEKGGALGSGRVLATKSAFASKGRNSVAQFFRQKNFFVIGDDHCKPRLWTTWGTFWTPRAP